MSHKEEQLMEVEALESIFPNEIEIVETEPFHLLRFTFSTENYDDDPDNGGELMILIHFSFKFNPYATNLSYSHDQISMFYLVSRKTCIFLQYYTYLNLNVNNTP